MSEAIRVIVAEDDPLAQRAIETYLEHGDGVKLVGVASDGAEALELALRLKPDVALLDIHMPELDGIEVALRMAEEGLECKVVCFTALSDDRTLLRAIQAGASGFLLKSDSPTLVIQGIHSAYSGDALVSPKLVMSLLRSAKVTSDPPPELNPTERHLLSMIGQGLSNAEMAEELFLATSTIKTYVSRLLTKLERSNRAALAALAHEWGIVER